MPDPHYPAGVTDANLEDDQHCALPDSEFRAAQNRDMWLEEQAEQREMDERAEPQLISKYGHQVGNTCKNCACVIDVFGCGCNPPDA